MTVSEAPDFTKEDMGKYKPPETVGGIPYSELERRVLVALNADHRTLPQIKRHADLPPGFDLSQVITGMELDELIRRCDNGTTSAYFHFTHMPKKFWVTGGTVAYELDTDFRPTYRGEPGEKKSDFKFDPAVKTKGKEAIPITEEQMERAAAENTNSQKIAEAVGYSSASALYLRFKAEPKLRDAYDRGRRAFAEKQGTRPTEAQPAKSVSTSQTHSTKRIDLDPMVVEEIVAKYGVDHNSRARIAEALGIGASTWDRKREYPTIAAAVARGLARRNAQAVAELAEPLADPTPPPPVVRDDPARDFREPSPFIPTDEEVAKLVSAIEPVPSSVRPQIIMEIDEREIAPAPGIPAGPTVITFTNGGQLAIGFNGNFFGLTREERQTMNAIADLIDVAG